MSLLFPLYTIAADVMTKIRINILTISTKYVCFTLLEFFELLL